MKLIMENWRSYMQELKVTKPPKPCMVGCEPCYEWYEYMRNPGSGNLFKQKKAAAVEAGCFSYGEAFKQPGRCYEEYKKYADCRKKQKGSLNRSACDPCRDMS